MTYVPKCDFGKRDRASFTNANGPVLQRYCLDLSGKPAQDQLLELNFLARVVDVDPNQISLRIVVEHHAFGNFSALDARPFGQIDIKRVGLRMVIQFHGLNRRSGKALWMVTLSSSVTTLK